MEEHLEKIIKEKISADHLMYVSMKYTKTCDVMINLIKRWQVMIDYSIDALLEKAKRKKLIKTIPNAPKLKIDEVKLAKAIHRLCPKTASGRHYPTVRIRFESEKNTCRYCGMKLIK